MASNQKLPLEILFIVTLDMRPLLGPSELSTYSTGTHFYSIHHFLVYSPCTSFKYQPLLSVITRHYCRAVLA